MPGFRRSDVTGSWYARSTPPLPAQPKLQGRRRVDVAILGGGLSGLSTALELAGTGRTVAIVDAGAIGGGASGRNGGQVIFGFGCDQAVLRRAVGPTLARRRSLSHHCNG